MGEPQAQFAASAGADEEWLWGAGRFHFHACFGTGERVKRLKIDELEMTQAEKLLLTCAATRQ